jgi:hypothetical protein
LPTNKKNVYKKLMFLRYQGSWLVLLSDAGGFLITLTAQPLFHVVTLLPNRLVIPHSSQAEGCGRAYSDLDLVTVSLQPLPLALQAEVAEAFCQSDLPA